MAGSISDFTLRLNPSAENIPTQTNDENTMIGGRFSNMQGLRQSLDTNQLLTQDEEEEKAGPNA